MYFEKDQYVSTEGRLKNTLSDGTEAENVDVELLNTRFRSGVGRIVAGIERQRGGTILLSHRHRDRFQASNFAVCSDRRGLREVNRRKPSVQQLHIDVFCFRAVRRLTARKQKTSMWSC